MGRTSDARQHLITAAMNLFYNNSFNAIGVQEICDLADVKKGSFYYFFESKQALGLAVIDSLWDFYQKNILTPIFVESDAPIEDKFYNFFERHYQIAANADHPTRGCHFGNLSVELSTQDDIIRDKLDGVFSQWIKVLETALLGAIDKGELPESFDAKSQAETIMALFEGGAVIAKTYDDPVVLQRLGKQVVSLLNSAKG